MAKSKLDQERTVYYCSSSIANFREKLHKRLGLEVWHWLKNRDDRVIFFGLYHWKDYLRFIWHRGERRVFWCGSDILNLRNGYSGRWWKFIIPRFKAIHFSENEVEWETLRDMGFESEIRPMIFDDPTQYQISYSPYLTSDYLGYRSRNQHVYISCRLNREKEYGLELVRDIAPSLPNIIFHIYGVFPHFITNDSENVIYHGEVPEEQFNEEIKNYQASLRLNRFDGFSEILAKSVLLGQYPVSTICYRWIAHASTRRNLIRYLKEDLPNYKEPDYATREYWLKTLEENLKAVKGET